MRIIPVLDLMQGRVVRAVAGRRHTYQPVTSRLTPSSQPVEVARAFRTHFGLTELYLADLDAIRGSGPALATFAALREDGFHLWVDAGVETVERVRQVAAAGVEGLVVGLETVAGPEVLGEAVGAFGDRVTFSLDLRAGAPLGNRDAWAATAAWSIAGQAVGLGVRHLLVLDLARIGVGTGTGTEDMCARLAQTYPGVEVSAGGGVRGMADVRRLGASGVRGVLVATALHDGTLCREDLAEL